MTIPVTKSFEGGKEKGSLIRSDDGIVKVDMSQMKNLVKNLPRNHPLRKVIEVEDDYISITDYYHRGQYWLKLAGSK